MNSLAEYAIAIADLVEAEGRALRRSLALLGWAFALIAVVTVFVLFGIGLWIWAVYLFADTLLPSWLAAAVAGAIVLGIAGVLVWLTARNVR